MRIFKSLSVFILILLLFPGCYWYETLTLRIDLTAQTGKVEFANIVSLPDKKGQRWKKSNIKHDWEEFYKAYDGNALMDSKELQVLSKELYKKDKQLNATVQFKYKELGEIDIKKSADNKMYLMKKGPNDKVLETNGRTMMIDSVEYLGWDVNEKVLFVKYQLMGKDQKRYSLAPYYDKWKAAQARGAAK